MTKQRTEQVARRDARRERRTPPPDQREVNMLTLEILLYRSGAESRRRKVQEVQR